jgi:pilus assembly protein CpaF
MGLLDRVKTTAQANGGESAESEHEKQARRKRESALAALRAQVHERLVEELGEDILFGDVREDKTLKAISTVVESVVENNGMVMHRAERERVIEELSHEILGLGPIEPLIRDPEINEVMVNGPDSVYVERAGRLEKTAVRFKDKTHVLRIIEKIVSPLGRRIDEASPMVDARLKDGSRVNAIIPPLALTGPCLTIRKFSKDPFQVEDLIGFGTISREIATFLESCVRARLNIIVSGGTGSGKTTTLNVLSSFIPTDERIVTVEDAAELQLRQDHVVTLESRPPNIEGKGHVSIRDLVRNCLRMRPDRIVIGEVRGGESLDMLQAMNTGHDGSITTAHSNSPRDTLARIETMVLMAGMDLPLRAIREQICSALDLIVHQERLKDGTRRITHITEVLGLENNIITLQDIFKFESQGVDDSGRYIGKIKPTGIVPQFVERFKAAGIKMPLSVFCEV